MKLPRSVWLLGTVSLLTDVASETIYPLLPIFLSSVLGAGAGAIGIIEGIAESTASLVKMVSGWQSDRTGTRKPFVLFGYSFSALCRPFIGLAPSWIAVLFLRFADRVGKGIRTAPRDAMLASIASAGDTGKIFGFHRSMDHAGAILGPLLATMFLFFYPGEFRTLFLLTIFPGIASVVVLFFVPESKAQNQISTVHYPRSWAEWKSFQPNLRRYLLILFLFTLGNSTDAFLLLRLNEAGVEVRYLPLLWAALHVVKSMSTTLGGIVSDRIGRKKTILAGWVWYAIVYFGLAVLQDSSAVTLLFLAYGLFYGLTEGSERALVADLSRNREVGTAFGAYHAVSGIALLPASLLFGFLWQTFGFAKAFGTGALLAALASIFLWKLPLTFHPNPLKQTASLD